MTEAKIIPNEKPADNNLRAKLTAHFGHSLNSFFHISLKNRYLYVQNPKVASSTIKGKLIATELEGTNINPGEVGLHPDVLRSVHIKPYQISNEIFEDILASDSFIRFSFVRSPISRILSAYLDKIERNEPEGVLFKKNMGIRVEESIDFSTFLTLLNTNQGSKLTWDPHWRPQYALLRPDLIKYSIIGKFEKFDSSYDCLNELLNGILGKYEIRAPHKTEASRKVRDKVSDKDIDLIYNIYKNDFNFFGYSADLE